jgi:hypothetical protein
MFVDRVASVRDAVERGAHLERRQLADLVERHQVRPEREEGVEALGARQEARVALQDVLGGHVDDRHDARDRAQRLVLAEVAAAATDDQPQLGLAGGALRLRRQHDLVARPDDGGRGLHEGGGLVGPALAEVAGVLGVVEADAEDLARVAQRRPDAPAGVGGGQPLDRVGVRRDPGLHGPQRAGVEQRVDPVGPGGAGGARQVGHQHVTLGRAQRRGVGAFRVDEVGEAHRSAAQARGGTASLVPTAAPGVDRKAVSSATAASRSRLASISTTVCT